MRFKDVRIYQKHIPEDAISDLVEEEQEWIGQTSIERSCMIDIEPLITCKECKHYTSEYGDSHFGLGFCLFTNRPFAHHQGFCAWGERND